MSREPGPQRQSGAGDLLGEGVELGPGAFGVDVVGGDRRDAAEVVDAGGQQGGQLVGLGEVRRGLHGHGRAEQQPGDGDRREVLLVTEVGGGAHRGVGLGAEVLHDAFLDRAGLAGDGADRENRLDALGGGLADANEQAGGERDADAAGVGEHAQPHVGVFVGRPEVGLAGVSKRRRDVVSSIIPSEGATGARRVSSAQLMTPGLRWGSRPVSSSTRIAMART